jgi:hypothetical protein
MPIGLRGTVAGCDSQPALLMKWDNGRTLSLLMEDSFRRLRPDEIEAEQYGNITAVCDRNPWLGNYREYPAHDYPYCMEEIDDLDTLTERFDHGNWSIRTGFLYGGLAFVQQVNGGDEWLALRQTAPGEWESFESISMEHILQNRGRDIFDGCVEGLVKEHGLQLRSANEIYTGADFQCDVTDGFPTVLCYDLAANTAWLEPSPAFYNEDDPQCQECMEACRAWGQRSCGSWERYNNLLQSLGEEAYENAAVEIEGEEQVFGGMGGMS